MLEILAQATQPAGHWAWSDVDWDKVIAYLTKVAMVAGVVAGMVTGGGAWVIVTIWGWRKKWNDLKAQADSNSAGVRFLAQASPASSTPVTPEIKAAVNDLATGAPPKT